MAPTPNPFPHEIQRKVEHDGEWYARTAAGEWLRWDDDAADWAAVAQVPDDLWDAPVSAEPPEEPTVTEVVAPVVLRGILWLIPGAILGYAALVLLLTFVFPETNDGRFSIWDAVAGLPGLIGGALVAGAWLWFRTKHREVIFRNRAAWDARTAKERGEGLKRTGRLP